MAPPSYFRKIDIRIWSDSKFVGLSAPQPNAQTLWNYLLTGPHTTGLPGLYVAGEAMLAEAIGWHVDDFRHCFLEIQESGMATADWRLRVVGIHNAIRYNMPQSPKVVKSWRTQFDSIPDCLVKRQYELALRHYLGTQSEAFLRAFDDFNTPKGSFKNETHKPDTVDEDEVIPAKTPTKVIENGIISKKITGTKKEKPRQIKMGIPQHIKEKIEVVIAHYNNVFADIWDKPLMLTEKRTSAIGARLNKFTVEELCRACNNIRLSPYHVGTDPKNLSGTVYATPDFIFRNDGNTEKWAMMTKATLQAGETGAQKWLREEQRLGTINE